jgi:hypothetical protein
MKEHSCLCNWRMLFVLALIGFATLSGCAPVLFKKPLSDQELGKVLSLLKAQEEAAATFFTTGQMVVKDWYWDQDANTLIAGTRAPLRLRIEITHAWGQPILHLLVVGKTFKALSYGERKLYRGDLTPGALSKFFPADLDADLIWDVVRGFPKLQHDGRVQSTKADRVHVLNRHGEEVEILELDPESGLPRQLSFPDRKVGIGYADFQQEGGILYAKEVKVKQLEGTRNVTLKNGKMVFNKPIPDEIFRMEIPPGFETEYIEKPRTN